MAKGYLRYIKKHDGSIGWFCEADVTRQEIMNDNALFLGAGLKQISNRCSQLDSLYGGRSDLSGYWILIQLASNYAVDSQCLLLYPKPPSTTWVIDQNVYIPKTQYHTTFMQGYNDLSGTQTGSTGADYTYVGENYSVAD